MSSKMFPVLQGHRPEQSNVKQIPWELIEPHREQAMTNHYQTLERLAERGGLSPTELWHVMHNRRWDNRGTEHQSHIEPEKAVEWLDQLLTP